MFSRLKRKNNDLMLKRPSEEIIKAHNDAEAVIRENNVDRFLLNVFMDNKGIGRYETSPELIWEFISSDWFLGIDFKCLLQIDDNPKRLRGYALLSEREIAFKGKSDIIINLKCISHCRIDGKKLNLICGDIAYMFMFVNGNLAKLFFKYLNSHDC